MRHPLSQSRHRTRLIRAGSAVVQPPLVIGCGNRDRGDDAAGLLVAEELRKLGINAAMCSGESSALLELWRAADRVILIDAVQTGAPLGTIHVWNAQEMRTRKKSGRSTHALGLAQAIDLARTLDLLPRELTIFGIEARSFAPGARSSPEAEEAMHEVVERVLQDMDSSITPSRRL
jgi:hydrogenase maturation protease